MYKKIFLGGMMLALWMGSVTFVSADLVINEVMYDLDGSDADREWIEVLNNGAEAVDIKSYVFKDSPSSSNHALTPSIGGTSVSAGGYAVIATDANKFRTDWPDFVGVLFSSNFSLGNTGETISIKPTKDLPASSEVTYTSSQGASGNGKSLQLVSGSWTEGTPTPGSENAGNPSTNDNINTNTNTNVANNTTTTTTTVGGATTTATITKKVEFVPPPRITAEIIARGQVVAGVPAVFEGKVLGLEKENIVLGKFYWNFGDGTIREIPDNIRANDTKRFEHIYKYPGEYVVTFKYYKWNYSPEPEAMSRLVVRATPAEIQISSVGSVDDPYVELYNPSSYEMDISKWVIQSTNNRFVIPDGTFVLPGKKIIISSEETRFSVSDLSSLSLSYPSGKKGFAYGDTTTKISPTVSTPKLSLETTVPSKSNVIANEVKKSMTEKSTQLAIVMESQEKDIEDKTSYWPIVGLVGIVGLASGASFVVRKRKSKQSGINADDIRIME